MPLPDPCPLCKRSTTALGIEELIELATRHGWRLCDGPLNPWLKGKLDRAEELERMPEGWRVHSLRLEAVEAERDRVRLESQRLREALGVITKDHDHACVCVGCEATRPF